MALALLLSPEAAGAVPADTAASNAAEPRVVLRMIGNEQALALLQSTAEELFQRLGVRVEVVPITEAPPETDTPALAIATIEITPPLCSIVIVDGVDGTELDRRTFSESSVETAVEAAAHIAYFVVETRLAANETAGGSTHEVEPGPTPALEAPPPASAVVPAPAAARPPEAPLHPQGHEPPSASDRGSIGVDLGLTFSVVSLGSGRVRPGSGLTGELRFPSLGIPLGVLVAATTHAASDLEFQGASAELRPSVLRLLATLDLPLGSALAFSLGAGGGVEWLRLTPTGAAEGVQVSGTESMFEPLVTGVAGLRIKLGERAFLSALGGIDVGLNPKSFTANTAEGEEVLLHMPSLRPMMLVGAAASLDQSPRFGGGEAR